MVRKGGVRRKTRYKLKKERREKGKISLRRYFESFEIGESVYLQNEPAVQKGMYHPRYMGKVGVIKAKRGTCYEVTIHDINKEKIVIAHPVHLAKVK